MPSISFTNVSAVIAMIVLSSILLDQTVRKFQFAGAASAAARFRLLLRDLAP